MTVIVATIGFTPGKVQPVLQREEDKEELVLFHDKDKDGKSKRAAVEASLEARKLDIPTRLIEIDAFDLVDSSRLIRNEIRKRRADGKDVVVSIAGGTRVLASAALLASILEGVRVVHVNEQTNEPVTLPLLKLSASEILNDKQRRVLRFIREHPACLQREIAASFKLSKGTVSHHVQRLKRQGLVDAHPDKEDARSERLRVVPSAELLLME